MNKKSIGLIFLLALSMISMIPVLSKKLVAAAPVPKTGEVEWADPNGQAAEANLTWNPEFLKLWTFTTIHSNTTIIVQGTDAYGQNIEAKVVIPPGTPMENPFQLNDTHTTPPMQVAFSHITAVFQQNGTHNNRVLILTEPEPFEDYLGEYHADVGYEPGQCHPAHPTLPAGLYYIGHGDGIAPTTQSFPVEPSNPDPLKIVINWADAATAGHPKDLIPQTSELGHAYSTATLTLEGLDEVGNKLTVNVTVHAGDSIVRVNAGLHTFSTLCKVWGGGSDSYYILTEPSTVEIPICIYTLLIDHLTIQPACYDILANPQSGAGNTTITVALVDQDGNLIHAGDDTLINFWTSGGKIQPSNDVWIPLCSRTVTVNLTADTNARTIKVVADANVPECSYAPAMNLVAWTEMTFDGINSVFFTGGWPIHTMMWGYTDKDGVSYTLPVPPKPVLPPELGGPEKDGIKLDGPIYEVMIPLYVGCNLISCPVHPMLCTNYYCEAYPTMPNHAGIPMDLLFGNTSATTCIEAIWWYNGSDWFHYIPGVDDDDSAYFTDGVGYWIYAEKPCTLEISGVFMDNAPFTPPLYTLTEDSWNLMGVTSLTAISLDDYCGGAGPVWVYDAKWQAWARNPPLLWPTLGFWVYGGSGGYIAP